MEKILVEYSSNNSGGSWWLDKEDWLSLEKAGWKVKWGKGDFIYKEGRYTYDKDGYPVFEVSDEEWLGAPAKHAWYICKTPKEALESFEKATGKDITDEGCNCCGAPHSFSWEGGYCSGEDCGEYLLGENLSGLSKRELLEKLRGKE